MTARRRWLASLAPLLAALALACGPAGPAAATPPAPPADQPTVQASAAAQPPGPAVTPSPARPSAEPSPSPAPSPAPTIRLASVPLDLTAAKRLQDDVDQGHMPWRLSPLDVAREEGQKLGFSPTDQFTLLRQVENPRSGTNQAVVRAVHAGQTYEIRLIQPVKVGTGGIWAIDDVRLAE